MMSCGPVHISFYRASPSPATAKNLGTITNFIEENFAFKKYQNYSNVVENMHLSMSLPIDGHLHRECEGGLM